MSKIFNLIIRYSLYGLIFLIPLFWLPWTTETYEFNKLFLLVILTAVAFMAWLAKMALTRNKIVFYRTPLDIFILIFMALIVLNAIFSIDSVSSWAGDYGRFSNAAAGFLALGLIYFVILNNVKKVKKLSTEKLLNLFIGSSAIVVLISYLSLFKFWEKISVIPSYLKNIFFNPISANGELLSVFLGIIVGVAVGLFIKMRLAQENSKFAKGQSLFLILLTFASLFLMAVIDSFESWLVLGISMFILVIASFWTRLFRERINLLILPILLILISLTGLSMNFQQIFQEKMGLGNNIPQEVILDYGITFDITWQTLKEYPLLGSGLGTFTDDFNRFKPAEFNQSSFWNFEFDRAPSQILEMVSTTGVLGVLSCLALMIVALLISLAGWRKSKQILIILPLFLGFVSSLVAQFVYYGSLTIYFPFWAFLALIVVSLRGNEILPKKKISFSFKKLPEVGLIMNVVMIILFFGLVALIYLGFLFYKANVSYKEFVVNQPAELKEAVSQIERVVRLDPYRWQYHQRLSQFYLIAAQAEADKPKEQAEISLIQGYVSGAIQQAKLSTEISPNLFGPWLNLGNIYSNSRLLVNGALPFAIDAYNKALELNPYNPILYRELCRSSLFIEENDFEDTIYYCQKAIELKPNYLDAQMQLALVFEKKGDLEAATRELESILAKMKGTSFSRDSQLAQTITEIYFQLGRFNFNLKNFAKAINWFEQSVIVAPQYSNARYGLALAYQNNGRLKDAIIQMEILAEAIPDNEQVRQILATMRDQALSEADAEEPED